MYKKFFNSQFSKLHINCHHSQTRQSSTERKIIQKSAGKSGDASPCLSCSRVWLPRSSWSSWAPSRRTARWRSDRGSPRPDRPCPWPRRRTRPRRWRCSCLPAPVLPWRPETVEPVLELQAAWCTCVDLRECVRAFDYLKQIRLLGIVMILHKMLSASCFCKAGSAGKFSSCTTKTTIRVTV